MLLDAQPTSPIEEWHVTTVGGLPEGFLLTLGVLGLAALIWTWRSLDPSVALKYRLGILSLRTFGLALVAFFLLQPNLTRKVLRPEPNPFAIVVDVSGSMTMGGARSRLARSTGILAAGREAIDDLAAKHRIEWYAFGKDAVPVKGPGSLKGSAADGAASDIRAALIDVARPDRDDRPSGILLLSDGADTSDGRDPRDTSWASDLDVPVNAIPITSSGRTRDLAITGVKVDKFAFSRSATPMVVEIKGIGIDEEEVEVSLWQSGSMVRHEKAILVGGEGEAKFSVQPIDTGRQVMTFTVPVPEGDEIPANNVAHAQFEVIRDKFRILHLAGRPSWDQRFLRETLEAWPRVDLVSFYVLRTPYQSSTLGSSGLALIPFPTTQLFENHLDEFDLVIMQDLEPSEVGLDSYLDEISKWVEGGGGLVVMGGLKTFGPSAMGKEPFSKILPVSLLPAGTPANRIAEETPFRLELTEAGERHPLTYLDDRADRSEARWKSTPRLDGMVKVARLTEGAITLACHPSIKVDDGPAPLIAVKDSGEGRSMTLMTDSTWRLRFTGPMQGGQVDTYEKFWRRTVSWMTRDPQLDRLRLEVSPSAVKTGEKVSIEIGLLDEAYLPGKSEEVECRITWLDPEGLEREDGKTLRLDENGRFRLDWRPVDQGPHTVTVTAPGDLEASDQFLARAPDVEDTHLEPDEGFLEEIAALTGGRYIDGDRPDLSNLARRSSATREALSREDRSLWDRWWALALVLAVLLGEWMLRRKMGLN